MARKTNEKFSTSQHPPKVSRSLFIETVRSILERDPITSPFSPEQSTQTLEEYDIFLQEHTLINLVYLQ